MNEKTILLIITIAVIAAAACGVLLLATQNTTQTQYTTIALSGSCTIEVPLSDQAVTSGDDYGIRYYVDRKNNLNITSFNSQDGATLSGSIQMAAIRDNIQIGATPIVTEEGITVYQNPDTKLYSIFTGNDTTHDNILIVSDDLDTVIHAYKSITYGEVNDSDTNITVTKNTNSSDRYVQDENGLFDTVTGKYVGGQFDGSTKEEVAQYNYDISHEGYYDYYDYVEDTPSQDSSSQDTSSSDSVAAT